ncbi:helix-turn-helix domain-containing protein [Nocardiopsis sp. ARC36]
MTSTLRERMLLPPNDRSELVRFARGLAEPGTASRARLVGPDRSELEIPDELYGVLRDVVSALSQGLAISIAPHNTMLTTQEAAELLGVSRPTLVRLLEDGEIPHSMRGATAGSCSATCWSTRRPPGGNANGSWTRWRRTPRRPGSTM